ncbi:hypothetical protein KA005_54985, partial [bacterium]|nr:hypothetical protein [bacterium]
MIGKTLEKKYMHMKKKLDMHLLLLFFFLHIIPQSSLFSINLAKHNVYERRIKHFTRSYARAEAVRWRFIVRAHTLRKSSEE